MSKKTKIEVLDSWGEYVDAVKEDMLHNKVESMDSIEVCDRCEDFLSLVMKDDGDIKYFCPRCKVSIGWESICLRGIK